VNKCVGHAINICLQWTDPTGQYFFFRVFYRLSNSVLPFNEVDSFQNSVRVTNLVPSTSYDFIVAGISLQGVESFDSITTTFKTGNARPKQIPQLDLTNIACAPTVNAVTRRVNVACSWTNPTANPPIALELKCRCLSQVREPVRIKKDISGAKAASTQSVVFQINRDVTSCNVYIKAVYAPSKGKHIQGTRWHLNVVVGS